MKTTNLFILLFAISVFTTGCLSAPSQDNVNPIEVQTEKNQAIDIARDYVQSLASYEVTSDSTILFRQVDEVANQYRARFSVEYTSDTSTLIQEYLVFVQDGQVASHTLKLRDPESNIIVEMPVVEEIVMSPLSIKYFSATELSNFSLLNPETKASLFSQQYTSEGETNLVATKLDIPSNIKGRVLVSITSGNSAVIFPLVISANQ